jgi:SAM-dependent methyltransferase
MSYYRDQLEAWLKTIDVRADSVLDIGGGANPVKGRTKSWEVRAYQILDNNAEGEFSPYFKYDLNDILPTSLAWHKFDVIFCLEVFEYIFNPLVSLNRIFLMLETDGILYISFPAIYPVHNPREIDYLRYTKKGIEKLLEKAMFSSWEIIPRVATKGRQALSEFYSLEGMHPVKGDDIIFDIGYMCKCIK